MQVTGSLDQGIFVDKKENHMLVCPEGEVCLITACAHSLPHKGITMCKSFYCVRGRLNTSALKYCVPTVFEAAHEILNKKE